MSDGWRRGNAGKPEPWENRFAADSLFPIFLLPIFSRNASTRTWCSNARIAARIVFDAQWPPSERVRP